MSNNYDCDECGSDPYFTDRTCPVCFGDKAISAANNAKEQAWRRRQRVDQLAIAMIGLAAFLLILGLVMVVTLPGTLAPMQPTSATRR